MSNDNNRIFLIALLILVGGFLLFMFLPKTNAKKNADAHAGTKTHGMSPEMQMYSRRIENPLTPEISLSMLQNGNQRYVQMKQNTLSGLNPERRKFLEHGQWPYAIILTTSDSRISPEYVFDAGLGDLVVIRNAGHNCEASVFSAIENVLINGNCRLLVVMGHEDDPTIRQAIKKVEHPDAVESFWTEAAVQKIVPSVLNAQKGRYEKKRMEEIVSKLHVESTIATLKSGSKIIQRQVDSGKIKIIGAYARIRTGKVDFISVD
ncbi:MAG: carbonic anhydrase [Victivallaceae bacterium]